MRPSPITVSAHPGVQLLSFLLGSGIYFPAVAQGLLLQVGMHRRRSKIDTRAYVIRLTKDGYHLLKVAEPLAKKVDAVILRALGGRAPMFLDHLSLLAAGREDPASP